MLQTAPYFFKGKIPGWISRDHYIVTVWPKPSFKFLKSDANKALDPISTNGIPDTL